MCKVVPFFLVFWPGHVSELLRYTGIVSVYKLFEHSVSLRNMVVVPVCSSSEGVSILSVIAVVRLCNISCFFRNILYIVHSGVLDPGISPGYCSCNGQSKLLKHDGE